MAAVYICFTAIRNLDILGARHFLCSADANAYAVSAFAAKTLFILADVAVIVSFPWFSQLEARGRHPGRVLAGVMGTYFALGACAVLAAGLAAPWALAMMKIDNVHHYAPLLRILAAGHLLLGGAWILVHYHLARLKRSFLWILIPAGAAFAAVMLLAGLGARAMAWTIIMIGAVLCAGTALLAARRKTTVAGQ